VGGPHTCRRGSAARVEDVPQIADYPVLRVSPETRVWTVIFRCKKARAFRRTCTLLLAGRFTLWDSERPLDFDAPERPLGRACSLRLSAWIAIPHRSQVGSIIVKNDGHF